MERFTVLSPDVKSGERGARKSGVASQAPIVNQSELLWVILRKEGRL